jgi:HPt (histidine-containing phosphotransfer) domain-containing protein
VGNDRKKVADFVRRFLDTARADLAKAQPDLLADNKVALNEFGHHLRSPAFMVGAHRVAALCRKMEEMSKGESGDVPRLLEELHAALDQVEARLQTALDELR